MGKGKFVTALERFELGRPGAWTCENLLKRSLRLVRYCRSIITARGRELGEARDRDYKYKGIIEKLHGQLGESEVEIQALDDRIGRLQEVVSAAAWVIADHVSGGYDALVPPGNKRSTSKEHGDGICRVLASHLAKLELPEDMEGVEDFISDDFERTHGLLSRDLPEEIKR